MAKKFERLKEKNQKLYEYTLLHEKGLQHFRTEYWKDAEENVGFRRAKHYTTTVEKDVIAQGRIPYSLPLVEAKGNVILAQQQMTPYDLIAISRTKEREIEAEIINIILKYETDVNDLKYILSEWFYDALFKKYGCMMRKIDRTDDPDGAIVVEKLLMDQCIWDTNCKKYDVSLYGNWYDVIFYFTRDELAEIYNLTEEEAKGLPISNTQNNQDVVKYKDWYSSDRGQDLIKVVRHHHRRFKTVWKVTMNDSKTEESDKRVQVDSRALNKTADELLADAQNGYLYPVKCHKITDECIEVCDYTPYVERELDEWTIDSKRIPVHNCYSNFDDGEIWCLGDVIKHPMKFIDRLTAQFDAHLGKQIKMSYQTEWDLLMPEEQDRWDDICQGLIEGGEVIKTRGANGRDVIKPIASGTVPPELFTLWQFMVKVLEDVMGGASAQGIKETANESGVAVKARQEAGFTMAYTFLYQYGRALKYLGEGLVEDIQEVYGSAEQKILEITDDDMDDEVKKLFAEKGIYVESKYRKGKGYVNLGKETLKKAGIDLGQARTRVIIDRGEFQPTMRQRLFNQFTIINEQKVRSGERPYPYSLIADKLDFSPILRRKMEALDEKENERQQIIGQAKMFGDMNKANLENMKEKREAFKDLNAAGNEMMKSQEGMMQQ